MSEYPEITPDGEELFFPNMWRTEEPQEVGDTDCFDFNAQPNEVENLIVMKLTGSQLLEMLSALYIGAEFTYPEKFLEVIRPLLSATACPPLLPEQECFDYPSYASFMAYAPMNPYLEPNEIADGYLTMPFLVNGENGNDFDGYEHFDVIVPFDAITFDVNWFDDIAGQLPTLNVVVQGAGTVLLKFLTIPQGGLVVVTVDNPPNLIDILSGIVTGADNIIDLNLDNISLPPETAKEIIFETVIVGTGLHTVYAVFLPILDDSLIPIRFGGGFRGVQLCNFIPEGNMGITNLRFLDCNLEQQVNGVWEVVNGWEDWLDCIPTPPSSAGSGALVTSVEVLDTVSVVNVTNTTFNGVPIASFQHTFTYPNAIIMAKTEAGSAAGQSLFSRVYLASETAVDSAIDFVDAATTRTIMPSSVYNDISPLVTGSKAVGIECRVTGGTGFVAGINGLVIIIIEYANPDDLFVEDIRIVGNELQKKIGGAWITVSDSLAAILASITAIANNAQATANNALSVANGAVSVNNAQATAINSLDNRLDSIETIDIPQINLTLGSLDSRLDVIEPKVDALSFGAVWAWEHDFTLGNGGYVLGTSGSGYSAGVGWVSNVNGLQILFSGDLLYENQICLIQCQVIYSGAPTGSSTWHVNNYDLASFRYNGIGNISLGWYRLPNKSNQQLTITFQGSGNFTLVKLRYLGRGNDVPFD